MGGELVDFAAGGNLNLMGLPEREPIKFGGNAGQYIGAVSCLSGSLLALYSADGTGAGQHVDVSIQEALVCCHIQDLCNYAYTGEVQGRGHGSMIYPMQGRLRGPHTATAPLAKGLRHAGHARA